MLIIKQRVEQFRNILDYIHMLRNVIVSTHKCDQKVNERKPCQNSLSWLKKAIYAKPGIMSYRNRTNPPTIPQSNQYLFLRNKTSPETA